jgi:molybdopterin molybdotransferase
MISEEEARMRILKKITPLPERTVPLATALNCFSARNVFACVPLPTFDNFAMAGYAVVSSAFRTGE